VDQRTCYQDKRQPIEYSLHVPPARPAQLISNRSIRYHCQLGYCVSDMPLLGSGPVAYNGHRWQSRDRSDGGRCRIVINLVTGPIGRLSLMVSVTLYVVSCLLKFIGSCRSTHQSRPAGDHESCCHGKLIRKSLFPEIKSRSFKCGQKWG
jgi:hypothetical protein